jgi:hypothetical protein
LADEKVWYATIKGEVDHDYKIEKLSDKKFEVTDISSGEATTLDVDHFNVDYGALVRFKANGEDRLLQFLDSKDGL